MLKQIILYGINLYLLFFSAVTSLAADVNPVGKLQQTALKKGEVLHFRFTTSKIYPGTERSYWIYIPAAYLPGKPACLFISMDGIQFNAPDVFDTLITKGEMPVTIGVFVEAGTVMKKENEPLRFNRSNEFDRTDNTFSRFLLDELLPVVEQQHSSDGRAIRLSKRPEDRALSGASSGAICAFTVAWQRPDAFSRVFSAIGTYVGMRGGDAYPTLIRKTEPKRIRVFLQDGEKDTWNPLFGNWYAANLNMEAALRFAGYEVAHAWGKGGHDGQQAQAIFPDVMRWLWKGWPDPVQSGRSANDLLQHLLLENQDWQQVALESSPGRLVAAENGDLLWSDSLGRFCRLSAGGDLTIANIKSNKGEKILACTGNSFYVANERTGVLSIVENGKKHTLIKNVYPEDILSAANGQIYAIEPKRGAKQKDKLWLFTKDGHKKLLDTTWNLGNRMAIYPDHSMLLVNEAHSQWIYSYVIQADGSLTAKQRWYWLHAGDASGIVENGQMSFDLAGNLYVGTALGVQICDQNGRVRGILPFALGSISSLCFGGKDMDTLYVVSAGKLYKRKLNVHAAFSDKKMTSPVSQGAG